jgi:hypothetical protein
MKQLNAIKEIGDAIARKLDDDVVDFIEETGKTPDKAPQEWQAFRKKRHDDRRFETRN